MYCLELTWKCSVYKNYQILSLHFSSVSQYKDYAHIFPVLSPGAISDVVFYLDIMDLLIYSLATLVPLCVFYATMRQVYWGLAYYAAFS